MEYKVTLNVKFLEEFASFSDFERELEQFNASNIGMIEAKILDYSLEK